MKFLRLISLIVLIKYNLAQEDEQQELKLNILPVLELCVPININ